MSETSSLLELDTHLYLQLRSEYADYAERINQDLLRQIRVNVQC